jgi:hypothetical protein
LLTVADPGPMPDEVLERIQHALAMLQGAPGNGAQVAPAAAPPARDEAPTAAWRRFADEGPRYDRPLAASSADPFGQPAALDPAPLARGGRGPSRSRRDLRVDDRLAERFRRVGQHRLALTIAASSVAVLVLGVVVLNAARDAPAGQSATAGAAALSARGATAAVVGASELNYTADQLATQARALVRQKAARRSGSASPVATTRLDARASTGTTVMPQDAPGIGNSTLQDPAKLHGCLVALGLDDRQPVAVDLARYQGRDAAIIVMQSVNGGYDVWVVARDCRAGSEGTLRYLTLSP